MLNKKFLNLVEGFMVTFLDLAMPAQMSQSKC